MAVSTNLTPHLEQKILARLLGFGKNEKAHFFLLNSSGVIAGHGGTE